MAKRIALFSTGMDSLIMKDLYGIPNQDCLFVDMGTVENKIERQFIEAYFPGVIIIEVPLVIHELPNKIIPFRNNHLALLAANYGSVIYFAFTAGDTTRDKDYVFKSQMEGILNYFSLSEDKVKVPGPFTIVMPYKHMTKTEMVTEYINRGFDPYKLLTQSCSCYTGSGLIGCGRCRSCLRKFLALELNGVNTHDFFQEDPGKHMLKFYEESVKKNRKNELKEIELWNKLHGGIT